MATPVFRIVVLDPIQAGVTTKVRLTFADVEEGDSYYVVFLAEGRVSVSNAVFRSGVAQLLTEDYGDRSYAVAMNVINSYHEELQFVELDLKCSGGIRVTLSWNPASSMIRGGETLPVHLLAPDEFIVGAATGPVVEVIDDPTRWVVCPLCEEQVYKDSWCYEYHMLYSHAASPYTHRNFQGQEQGPSQLYQSSNPVEIPEEYKCFWCGGVFNNETDLVDHLIRNHQAQPV